MLETPRHLRGEPLLLAAHGHTCATLKVTALFVDEAIIVLLAGLRLAAPSTTHLTGIKTRAGALNGLGTERTTRPDPFTLVTVLIGLRAIGVLITPLAHTIDAEETVWAGIIRGTALNATLLNAALLRLAVVVKATRNAYAERWQAIERAVNRGTVFIYGAVGERRLIGIVRAVFREVGGHTGQHPDAEEHPADYDRPLLAPWPGPSSSILHGLDPVVTGSSLIPGGAGLDHPWSRHRMDRARQTVRHGASLRRT